MDLRSPWPWLTIGLAAAASGAVWWWRVRAAKRAATHMAAPPTAPSFRDLLRQPDLWDTLEADFAATQDERRRAKGWTGGRVAAAVRRFVLELGHSDDDREDLAARLAQQPARAASHALQILEDPAAQPLLLRESRSQGSSSLTETPAQRACELLADHALPTAIPRLQALLGQSHDGTRKAAAMALGRTGDPAAVAGLRLALADRNEFVRSYAVIGLERAAEAGQLATSVREQLVAPLLDAALSHDDRKLADLAVGWNPEVALARFRGVRALTTNSPPGTLRMALDALTKANRLLPREELMALWRERPHGDAYPLPQCRAAIFTMLTRHGDPADDALLQELLLGGGEEAEAAAAAWMRRLGLADLGARLHEKRWKTRKPLSPAERRHDAMRMLDAEVCNGGFDQYFANSSGDDWEAALAGLAAFDPPRAALLREVVAQFATPPNSDRRVRANQLAALHEKSTDPLGAFDRRYFELPTPIDVGIARHAAAHVEELRG